MSNFLTAFLGALLLAVLLFVGALLGTLGGAFAGWTVGLLFPGTLALVSTTIFGSVIPAWQLGAALGFVGSFLSTSVSSSKN